MSEWIRVEDRLPDPRTYDTVLAYTRSGKIQIRHVSRRNSLPTRGVSGVTHWMPLPEPPEEAK